MRPAAIALVGTLLLPWPAAAQFLTLPSGTRPVSAGGCTIDSVTLSNAAFPGGTGTGTTVGAISVPATGCTFSGTLALGGTDAASFALSSSSLPSNLTTSGTVAAGSYSINITATDAAASNSPYTQSGIAITGTSTWSATDKDAAITVSGTGTGFQLTSSNGGTAAWRSGRSTASHNGGKYYFEVTSTELGGTANWIIGLALSTAVLNNYIGSGTTGEGFQCAGDQVKGLHWYNGANGALNVFDYCRAGDTLAVAVDLTAKKVWIKNLTKATAWNLPLGAGQDPAAGTGGISITITGDVYLGFSGIFGTPTASTAVLNTGSAAFSGTIPSGFAAWH